MATRPLKDSLKIFRGGVNHVWFPVQREVAKLLGNTRVRRIGTYLITPEQREEIDGQLLPGDILLSRKNWYLSNVGLPGFWPHAILYIGAPEKFQAYFDDPSVRAYLQQLTGKAVTLPQYLEDTHGHHWRGYTQSDQGQPYRVIEGVNPKIQLHTLKQACGDYLAALRPRLDKTAKA